MTTHQLCLASSVALALAVWAASPAAAEIGNPLLDPGIRHTNGMPIASSEPRRNSSVTWQCNPDHVGQCGCRYYWPCCDSLLPGRVYSACQGCYTPRQLRGYGTYIGSVCPPPCDAASLDGIEPTGMNLLGQLPNDAAAAGSVIGPVGPQPVR